MSQVEGGFLRRRLSVWETRGEPGCVAGMSEAVRGAVASRILRPEAVGVPRLQGEGFAQRMLSALQG